MIYFDTTFLVKLQIEEPGSERILSLLTEKDELVVTSVWGKMETEAALHRKLRERDLGQPDFLRVQRQFSRDIEAQRISVLPLTTSVIERVHLTFMNLPATIFLRAGDAIHLATAAEAGFKEIYSNDRHLLAAASLFKLEGINPLAK